MRFFLLYAIFYLCIYFLGGCYVTAKRKIVINSNDIPHLGLQTFHNKKLVINTSKILSFDPYGPLPKNYKTNYGIRICGYHENTQQFMLYGFDIFYQVSGNGLDLEGFLNFCFSNNLHIDWFNFQRSSIEKENWTLRTLVKKISYPIIEVYGKEYWEKLKFKIYKYEWSLLSEGEFKEQFRPLFEGK